MRAKRRQQGRSSGDPGGYFDDSLIQSSWTGWACGNQAPNRLICSMARSDASAVIIAGFGRKYLWWEPVGKRPHSEDRIIAQTMNLGTYDDILLLEQAVGQAHLVEVMLRAEPGWFHDRSWEFWRGRLSFATGAVIPTEAPRRTFDVAMP